MCGICGIFGTGDKDISLMMHTLEHRGHDSAGSFISPLCVLGHQRLAIVDLSNNGVQPMYSESSNIVSVTNGMIYNYKELRNSLQDAGHEFKSTCDCEVITHLYEQYGLSFPERLRGMFAIALLDKKLERLILVRDHVGKKPLYYHWDGSNKRLVFSSEIKALFEAGVPKSVNYSAIPEWMMFQYTTGEKTLFKDVYKLQAGCMLMVCPQYSQPYVRPYWSLQESDKDKLVDCSVEALREALEEATRLRMQSDVPVGTFLSGGVDSSAVTALYRKFYNGDLHTFTVSFPSHSEASFAAIVNRHLGTIPHEVIITPEMVANDLSKVTWHHDEPLGDAAILCNYYLAKEAKKYVSVILAGEGGDELFGGYPWHKYSKLLGTAFHVPYFIRHGLGNILDGDATSLFYRYSRLLGTLDQKRLQDILIYPTTAISKNTVDWLIKGCKRKLEYPQYRHANFQNIQNKMLASDFLNLLPEKFLMKADKGVMAWAVEERLPLLDIKVVEMAFQIDPDLKHDKWIMRKAVEDLLPKEITWRTKAGFGTPVGKWLQDKRIQEMVLDRIANGELVNQICDKKRILRMLSMLPEQNSSRQLSLSPVNVIWGLFALQVWHDVWFGK